MNHKTQITNSTLLALSEAGVEYVSTRSIGYNHIDLEYAERVGISVGNVAYSPDSVADYTLMLMLMAVRHAKSTIGRTDSHDYRLSETRGKELRDLTVGVVGTGRIGRVVAENEKVDPDRLPYPVLVKPARSGSSFGISNVTREDELPDALSTARQFDSKLLIEEAVAGDEIGCAVDTMPGMTSYSRYPRMMAAAGVPLSDLIDRLISATLHGKKR